MGLSVRHASKQNRPSEKANELDPLSVNATHEPPREGFAASRRSHVKVGPPVRIRNVLFLCTHNSARSVLAECYLNGVGAGRFRGFSAGSKPSGRVNPFALELLRRRGLACDEVRSKTWDEFARPDAPALDIVITVCDNAAGEVCPIWPGHPVTAHWGVPDPSAVAGSDEDKRHAFDAAYTALARCIDRMLALPIDELDPAALQQRLRAIPAAS